MDNHGGVRHEDFERLYEEHAQGLFAFLAYRTRDRTLAEDLLAGRSQQAVERLVVVIFHLCS